MSLADIQVEKQTSAKPRRTSNKIEWLLGSNDTPISPMNTPYHQNCLLVSESSKIVPLKIQNSNIEKIPAFGFDSTCEKVHTLRNLISCEGLAINGDKTDAVRKKVDVLKKLLGDEFEISGSALKKETVNETLKSQGRLLKFFGEETNLVVDTSWDAATIVDDSDEENASWEDDVEICCINVTRQSKHLFHTTKKSFCLRLCNGSVAGLFVETGYQNADKSQVWNLKYKWKEIQGCIHTSNSITFFIDGYSKHTYLTDTELIASHWCQKMNLSAFLMRERFLTNILVDSKSNCHFGIGDIVLFNIKRTTATLQRLMTNSDWDHVAIVVPLQWGASFYYGTSDEEKWALLEATGDGVFSAPLRGRLKQYSTENSVRMSVRHLMSDKGKNKKPELASIVNDLKHFFQCSAARPYSKGKVLKGTGTPSTGYVYSRKLEEESCEQGYFCSELVARALSSMRVLNEEKQFDPCNYWPKSFSWGDYIDQHMKDNFKYSCELPLDIVNY